MAPYPLVSIVIPTSGRGDLLRRAVSSCLEGGYADVTEVVVVPNGPDTSWESVFELFKDDARVRFHSCDAWDRDAARNKGIELARGELLRFLDDDDYLLPDAAGKQYEMMLEQGVDFSTAGITVADRDGTPLRNIFPPFVESGLVAALRHDRLQIPLAHVYRRSTLAGLRWPLGIRQSEDIVWLIGYAVDRKRSWLRVSFPVGVWYQHDGPRMSLDRPAGFVHEPTARALFDAHDRLVLQGRLTSGLALTIGISIWECIHRAFPFNPVLWTRFARLAMRIAPAARPNAPVYRLPVHPLLLLWLLLPKRWGSILIQWLRAWGNGWDYRRRL